MENKMTDLQKKYCEEKGLIYINPNNTEISDYVKWLEDKNKNITSSHSQLLEIAKHYIKNHDYIVIANAEKLITN